MPKTSGAEEAESRVGENSGGSAFSLTYISLKIK
jgi:hypothetical protein